MSSFAWREVAKHSISRDFEITATLAIMIERFFARRGHIRLCRCYV